MDYKQSTGLSIEPSEADLIVWRKKNNVEDFILVFEVNIHNGPKYMQMTFRFYISKKDGGIYLARYLKKIALNKGVKYFGPKALASCRISLKANKKYSFDNSIIVLRTTKDNSGKILFTRVDSPLIGEGPRDQFFELNPFEVQVLKTLSSRYREQYKKERRSN